MKTSKLRSWVIAAFIFICLVSFRVPSVSTNAEGEDAKIPRFWDEDVNFCFHYQNTFNACGPASVQMVLKFFDLYQFPSQEKLAIEMDTTIYNYTSTDKISIPFKSRNIPVVFKGHFPTNFTQALAELKRNISLNRPTILLMWYDTKNITGHFRIVTGYNESGLYVHDPWDVSFGSGLYSGPNVYLNNTIFEKLWLKYNNWALIVEANYFGPSPTKSQVTNATSYLLSMYNPILGLIANSEESSPNPYGDGVACNRTYWIYDDNLWTGWALQPFNPSIAENITKTVKWYTSNYGRSMLFEAAIGEAIPTTIHSNKIIKIYDEVVNGNRVQVLLDRHQYADNPSIFGDATEYVDLSCYMAINYWMMGDLDAAEYWFRVGEKMWNSSTDKGFFDKAARIDSRYQNFKLGLFLLVQKITDFPSNITDKVETAAWNYQNNLGGITTQSWLNGTFYGTANTETTSALLLAYNDQLIDRLHKQRSYEAYELELAEKKLNETESQLNKATNMIVSLVKENNMLRNAPWCTSVWPAWFTILLTLIGVLTTSIIILILYPKYKFIRKEQS